MQRQRSLPGLDSSHARTIAKKSGADLRAPHKGENRFLTRSFKEARELAGSYADWKEDEMPGFHEVRALSLHLYKRAGKDGQAIAGHASETMTKNYQKDQANVIWSDAIPDLNISEITGQFCAHFAPVLRKAETRKGTKSVNP